MLNSIWQMAILWLVYLLLSASLRKQLTAHINHSLAMVLLAAGSLWFAFTLAFKYFAYSEAPTLVLAEEGTRDNFATLFTLGLRNLESLLPYLSSIYLAAIVILFFRFISQYRYTQHVTTTAVHKLQPQLRMYVQQIAARMGIKKEIRVWLSEIIDTPMTIGFWKPVILMPIASVNGLSTQQVEAILLHELAHIRRNDYLVNLLVATIDVILFFNPFSRLFTRIIRRERENSCDDLVLQFEYNPHAYASALLAIEQKRVMNVALGIAATGKNNRMLLDRVKRILNQPVTARYSNRMIAHLFAGMLLAFIAWSNPGNVIVKKILNNDTNTPVASTENNNAVFASSPVAATTAEKKEHKQHVTLSRKKEEAAIAEQEEQEVLSQLAMQVAFDAAEYIPTAIQAATAELRDFSITEQLTTEKPALATTITTPYVPSTSFSYYFQDSTKPGVVILSPEEKAANESLRKALRALEEVDWTTLEKQLKNAGDKLDIRKLQYEIKKSLQNVDWEKVNAESKLEQLQLDAKVRQDLYLRELTAVKNNAQMAEHYQNLQKKILQDQINCQQEQLKKEMELKNHLQKKGKTTTAKKIVVI